MDFPNTPSYRIVLKWSQRNEIKHGAILSKKITVFKHFNSIKETVFNSIKTKGLTRTKAMKQTTKANSISRQITSSPDLLYTISVWEQFEKEMSDILKRK